MLGDHTVLGFEPGTPECKVFQLTEIDAGAFTGNSYVDMAE